MAFKKNGEFKYSFRGINRIVEERGNQFIRFAQIAWKGEDEDCEPNEIKYDLRKYTTDSDGKERMLKGVSFLSEEGPHELTHILLEEGFGNTEKIIDIVKTREDFKDAVKSSYGIYKEDSDDGTFDLREIIK
jgi:hypothetical protein